MLVCHQLTSYTSTTNLAAHLNQPHKIALPADHQLNQLEQANDQLRFEAWSSWIFTVGPSQYPAAFFPLPLPSLSLTACETWATTSAVQKSSQHCDLLLKAEASPQCSRGKKLLQSPTFKFAFTVSFLFYHQHQWCNIQLFLPADPLCIDPKIFQMVPLQMLLQFLLLYLPPHNRTKECNVLGLQTELPCIWLPKQECSYIMSP